MNARTYLLLFGFVAGFIASMAVMLWWQKRQRKTRRPFGDDIRLLRTAGESQLRHVLKLDEDAILWMVMAGSVPVVFALLGIMATTQLPPTLQWAGVSFSAVLFVVTFILSAGWFAGKTTESHNRYLGYFGERMVGEHLDALKGQGWRIFHDVPGADEGLKFNLDHIAVGPTGVFVIETKTRRKGRARPGFEAHKVYFDGHSLVWPWGEDNHGLEQAEHNALWLARLLQAELRETVPVTPFLTLPGWSVEMKPAQDPRACRVTNPQGLDKFLPGGAVVLNPAQITAIAAKLEALCRDVAY
jgi:hypothetical protein